MARFSSGEAELGIATRPYQTARRRGEAPRAYQAPFVEEAARQALLKTVYS